MTKRVTITNKDLLRLEKGADYVRFFFKSRSHKELENIVLYKNGKFSCDCGDYLFGSPHDCVHISLIKKDLSLIKKDHS